MAITPQLIFIYILNIFRVLTPVIADYHHAELSGNKTEAVIMICNHNSFNLK
ncbi:hypothetical protein [Limnoraphis robusta]|uniref:hypothetical protein n=1 Tax=Limnoraphis robusta TaxID=1118279 RepID=UPI001364A0CF|nr:hypothetical protein [Limnoraphis robusta]